MNAHEAHNGRTARVLAAWAALALASAAPLVAACGAAAGATAGGPEIVVGGTDAMRFAPATIRVRAGEAVTLTLKNEGTLLHDLVTEGADRDARITNVPGRGQKSAAFRAGRAGTYPVVCAQPGHTEAGMVAQIVVTD